MAGAGDALSLRIPNWLTAAIGILFVPMAFATGMPLEMFGIHLLTGLVLFVAGFCLFAAGLFGGGDAKLLAAAGLWLGWPITVPFLVFTVLAGGALAVIVFVWSAFNLSAEIQGRSWSRRLAAIKPDVPYGFALAAGGILAFPESWWMR